MACKVTYLVECLNWTIEIVSPIFVYSMFLTFMSTQIITLGSQDQSTFINSEWKYVKHWQDCDLKCEKPKYVNVCE